MRQSQLLGALAFLSLFLFGATMHATPDMHDSPDGYTGRGDDDGPSKSLEATVPHDGLVPGRGLVRPDHVDGPRPPKTGSQFWMRNTSLLTRVRDGFLPFVSLWKRH